MGEIRRDETCLDYSGHDVVLYPCHGGKGNQMWVYDNAVSKEWFIVITWAALYHTIRYQSI